MTVHEMTLEALAAAIRARPSWRRKEEIGVVAGAMIPASPMVNGQPVPLGDDAAAIPVENGYLLLAAEVVYPPLVAANPYLAGRMAVLANANDIYAMGGYPLAIVDTILAPDPACAAEILRGLHDGCARYGVALVGGHLTATGEETSISVSILGRAKRLLTSFSARPGDLILHVINLRGEFHPYFPFWNCSGHLTDDELRRDLEVVPILAETGLCEAGRDISMTGLLGSIVMVLECSGVGAWVDLDAVPQPPQAADRYLDWLMGFPSYGFALFAGPGKVPQIQEAFEKYQITCAVVGEVTQEPVVNLRQGGSEITLIDLAQERFTGFVTR